MRAVVQRVTSARVSVAGRLVAAIERGLLVYVGIARDDATGDTTYLANKIAGMRVFADTGGRFDRSVQQERGAVLLVSQFTLCGDCRRGRRPSFDDAAAPETARAAYQELAGALRDCGVPVEMGEFQAHMTVESTNDGPVTMLLDSRKRF